MSGQGGAIFGARSQDGDRFRAESIRMAIAALLTIESGRPIHRLSQARASLPGAGGSPKPWRGTQ